MDQYKSGVVSLLREPSTKDYDNFMDPEVRGRARVSARRGKVHTGTESEWGRVLSRFPPLSSTPIRRSQQKGPGKNSAQGLGSWNANMFKNTTGQGSCVLDCISLQ